MKIIQINSVCGKGSTGRIAMDIAIESEKVGHSCYIVYGHGATTYSHSYKIGNKFDHIIHNMVFSRILGLQGFGSILSTIRLTKWIDSHKPNVVHLHNLHANYLNTRILFRYLSKRNIPIVFTLHDCYNFTGKCTYYTSVDCRRWKSECNHCPLKKRSGMPSLFFDWSKRIFRMKKKLYSSIIICHSVAVSKWLMKEAEQSILHSNGHPISYIYNWIDYNTFKPSTPSEADKCKKKYGLSSNKKYLISVSQEWLNGSIRLSDAIALAQLLPNVYTLILVGKIGRGVHLPDMVIHIPYISSKSELATLYSIADAYIHFSIQDTFGLVIGEAMACGTFPITYDSTACVETPGPYGIVVPPRDIKAIINSLPLLDRMASQRDDMIEYVKTHYDRTTNIRQYINLYEQLCNTNQ